MTIFPDLRRTCLLNKFKSLTLRGLLWWSGGFGSHRVATVSLVQLWPGTLVA